MPLAEACHVAVQRHPPAASGPQLLRIVSFRHGTAFELDLAELVGGRVAVLQGARRERMGRASWSSTLNLMGGHRCQKDGQAV